MEFRRGVGRLSTHVRPLSSETVRPGATGNEYKSGDSREGTSLSVTSVWQCWQEGGHDTEGIRNLGTALAECKSHAGALVYLIYEAVFWGMPGGVGFGSASSIAFLIYKCNKDVS